MQTFKPLRDIPSKPAYSNKDVLVIFGEVFARGYVNGLIDEAKKAGMKVIYATVGRRDEAGKLRPLNAEELATKDQPLINIPLECGFDLEKSSKGLSPVDQLKGLKLSEADKATLDWGQVEESRRKGRESFRARVSQYLTELEKMIPSGANVLIAHTMAGGVPRAKIILPSMNRIFKGYGDRFASSKEFWESTLGKFCAMSFMDVTANSYADLIDLSAGLREKVKKGGGKTSYVSYGYHGTEILIDGKYEWQSYSPYLQGFAKIELENISRKSMKEGIAASTYNAPEILTNSSSIFAGVEVPLYTLLAAFRKEGPGSPMTAKLEASCRELLKPEHSLDDILNLTNEYLGSDLIRGKYSEYEQWPQHNGSEQMEYMLKTSEAVVSMHKDEKKLLTAQLSEIVFQACGRAMICEGYAPREPVWWVGHDLVAKLALAAK